MHILLPIDGSELSLTAVRYTIRLLHQGLKGRVLLANVQAPASLYEMVQAPDADALASITEAAGQHALERAGALLHAAGLGFDSAVVSGDPVAELVELAESRHCDLIVIGGHPKGVLRTLVEGSLSHDLLQASAVPVLVVKPAQDG